jgi:hypothetical protein
MASLSATIKPTHFSNYVLPEQYPSARQSNGAGPSFVQLNSFNEAPPTLYMRGEMGAPFVQAAVFGDKDTQTELRAKFEEGDNLKVVGYVTPLQCDTASFGYFVNSLNRWGNGLAKEKFAKHYKNSRFQQCSVLKGDDGTMKLSLDLGVLAHLRDANGWDSYWSWPRGIYDIVFQITSFWVSPQGCGFTMKARRVALVEARVPLAKALAPECYEFGNEYDDKPALVPEIPEAPEEATVPECEVNTKRVRRAGTRHPVISDESS